MRHVAFRPLPDLTARSAQRLSYRKQSISPVLPAALVPPTEFSTSHALDDDGAIIGALVSMLARLAIGGAVIPGLGLVKGGKLEYDHAFDRRTLEYFLATIVCAGCNVVPRQGGRDLLRISVKLRLVAGSLARENDIGDHVHFLQFRLGVDHTRVDNATCDRRRFLCRARAIDVS